MVWFHQKWEGDGKWCQMAHPAFDFDVFLGLGGLKDQWTNGELAGKICMDFFCWFLSLSYPIFLGSRDRQENTLIRLKNSNFGWLPNLFAEKSETHMDTWTPRTFPALFTAPSHHSIIPSQGTLDRQHLIRTCFVDFDRSIVLVAEVDKAIMGAGRISREEMSDDFTFSLQVLPECRKKGGMAKGLRGGSCAVEVGDWRDWWPLFDFFLKLDNNSIHNIYIIDWEYIAVSNQQYDTRFGSWWPQNRCPKWLYAYSFWCRGNVVSQ